MVCGLIYGIAKMLRSVDMSQKNSLFLQGISTTALVALCVFANTTAFFREAVPIQTPLASILTGAFFVMLGAAVGIYVGSYLFRKSKRLGIGIPVLLSLCVTVLMYFGEAVIMDGNLYRFGAGWFLGGLPGIVLASVDILIVLLSGGLAGLILGMARKHERWPGKRTLIAVVALCTAVAATGAVIATTTPESMDGDIFGCYVFDENLYTNPFSSFMAFGGCLMSTVLMKPRLSLPILKRVICKAASSNTVKYRSALTSFHQNRIPLPVHSFRRLLRRLT